MGILVCLLNLLLNLSPVQWHGIFRLLPIVVILDMRGRQYHGRLYPGPTALILETPGAPVGKQQPNNDDPESSLQQQQQLKVIGVTDEFVRCEEQQGDIMERLSATYEQGGGDDDGEETMTKSATAKSTASSRKRAKTST